MNCSCACSRPRYPELDADFQNLLSYAGAELARYGSDPILARSLGGVLLRALHLRLFADPPRRPVGGLDLEPLDAHIRQNLARRISVAELAQVACLSPSHFHAQFKDSVGLSPHQYLLKTRLDRAARLLRERPGAGAHRRGMRLFQPERPDQRHAPLPRPHPGACAAAIEATVMANCFRGPREVPPIDS